MKTISKTMLIAASAALLCACGSRNSGSQADPGMMAAADMTKNVNVATAVREVVPQTETYSATVQAFATNNIAPQTGGRIQKINVEVGDFVSKGQILAEMDKVQLEQTALSLRNDSTELSRVRQLFDEGGVAKSDLEAMELAYNVRKSTYDNLLENTVLRSPISGVVTTRNYDRGDLYAGQAIFVVQQITPVKILVGISESDYTKVRRGDTVSLTVDALPGQTFTGRVNRIYPTVNAMTHTVDVEVLVQNSDRKLRPGMYAKVTVSFASRNSIVVPEEAVVKQQGSGQRIVYILKGNTVETREISLGRHIADKYEILEGLSEGEVIVTKGQTNLRNGDEVVVLEN